jgi:hypothetical protein
VDEGEKKEKVLCDGVVVRVGIFLLSQVRTLGSLSV